jgi:uncharacterized protein YbjT (DUF2867 family)
MKILVTGGTGFIGERLVAALGRRGDDVTVLSRRAGGSGKVRQVVWTPEQKGHWLDEVAASRRGDPPRGRGHHGSTLERRAPPHVP